MRRISGVEDTAGPQAVIRIAGRQNCRIAGREGNKARFCNPAILRWLLTRGSPRRLRDDGRQIRPPQHVVERGQLTAEDIAELTLRTLEAVLKILLNRDLLVCRLEIAAGE